jgi:hypothetical protein
MRKNIMPVESHEKKVETALDKEIVKRLDVSGFIVVGEIKQVITEKGLVKSGLYRSSINHQTDPDELSVHIGSPIGDLAKPKENPPYPLYLEVGTSRGIPAHAPMRTGLMRSEGKLKKVWD